MGWGRGGGWGGWWGVGWGLFDVGLGWGERVGGEGKLTLLWKPFFFWAP